jgi:hypothetical protein
MMPTRATKLTSSSKMKTLALGDVQGHDGDVLGLQGPMSIRKSKISTGSRSVRVPPKQRPSFFLVQIFNVFLPLVEVTTSICGILIPHEGPS